MKTRIIIAFILAALAVNLTLNIIACDPPPPCDLKAPDQLNITVIDSTTAQLNWSPVSNALGYQVIVIDSISNTTVVDTTIFAPDTFLIVFNLKHGNTYIAQIAPICKNGSISKNIIRKTWPQINLIIGDLVIQFTSPSPVQPGLSNCDECSVDPDSLVAFTCQ